MRVTFDSNVYRLVVDSSKFPNHPFHKDLLVIHNAVQRGIVVGLLSGTVATLEGVRRKDRADYFSTVSAKSTLADVKHVDRSIRYRFSIGPDHTQHPGLPAVFDGWLKDVVALGMRFMRAPRIGMPRPPIPESHYIPRPDNTSLKRFFELGREIKGRGVGIHAIENIGTRFSQRIGSDSTWFESLGEYRNKNELNKIADAVGEWADGDTVATHYAYANDILCTEDTAKSAGTSVFDATNRAWLVQHFDFSFASIQTLASVISNA